MKPEFVTELNRLIMMIDAANLQATMLKGDPQTKHRVKQFFEPFFKHGVLLSKYLKKVLVQHNKLEEYETESSIVFEAMREIIDSKNRNEALALLKAYNQGLILVVDED